jgi:diacylglycerol kinase family enzyme
MSPKIAFIVNEHSGSGTRQKALYKALQSLKSHSTIYRVEPDISILQMVRKAWNDGHTVVVASGGDGTVSAVASAILELGVDAKFGLVPTGTLNHFARDIGIPKTIDAALSVILKGKSKYIDVGKMNEKYFINNSSLGIYPFLIKERELHKRRGFGKWLGLLIASLTTFRRHPFVTVEFELGRKHFVRKTPFVFIGNNTYDMQAGRLGTRTKLDEGKLSLFLAQKIGRFRLIILAWHALRGKLTEQRDFDSIGLTRVQIRSRKKKIRVSYDGEVSIVSSPIRYSILAKALHVIIP